MVELNNAIRYLKLHVEQVEARERELKVQRELIDAELNQWRHELRHARHAMDSLRQLLGKDSEEEAPL